MNHFVTKPDYSIEQSLWNKINTKTKPLGSLGDLEHLAFRIGLIQQSTFPKLTNPKIIVFAGDHGIAKEGVSAYPQEVTYQMVYNFLNGGAAINVLSKQNGLDVVVVDAGVNHEFEKDPQLIDAKEGHGTESFLKGPAMTENQFQNCLKKGAGIVEKFAKSGTNVIGFGEMGIGNTSSASVIMSKVCGLPIDVCVGRGTGLDDDQLKMKVNTLRQSMELHSRVVDPVEVAYTFAGFEMVQMAGAMIEAARNNMIVMVDGFIGTASFLIARILEPHVSEYAVFCHQSMESGHKKMLDFIGAKGLLNLNMRLGEGSGCAVAFPLLRSAVTFLNEMASFEEAGVSKES